MEQQPAAWQGSTRAGWTATSVGRRAPTRGGGSAGPACVGSAGPPVQAGMSPCGWWWSPCAIQVSSTAAIGDASWPPARIRPAQANESHPALPKRPGCGVQPPPRFLAAAPGKRNRSFSASMLGDRQPGSREMSRSTTPGRFCGFTSRLAAMVPHLTRCTRGRPQHAQHDRRKRNAALNNQTHATASAEPMLSHSPPLK